MLTANGTANAATGQSNLTFNGTLLNITGDLGASGNTNISGTTAIAGATTVANTLLVRGITTISNALNVTGTTTAATLFVGCNVSISGTTMVSNALGVSGTFNVSGAISAASSLTMNGLLQGNYMVVSNISAGTTLTSTSAPDISVNKTGIYFNITNSAFSNITPPSSNMTAGMFWSLRNSTNAQLSITVTGTPPGIPSPLIIPPSNSVTLVASNATTYVIF